MKDSLKRFYCQADLRKIRKKIKTRKRYPIPKDFHLIGVDPKQFVTKP